MAAKDWALLLTDRGGKLPLDNKLLGNAAGIVETLPDFEQGLDGFLSQLAKADVEWVLVGVGEDDPAAPAIEAQLEQQIALHRVRYLSLEALSFGPHKEKGQANQKALKMIQGVMAGAEAGSYARENVLEVSGDVLLWTDHPKGLEVATKLHEAVGDQKKGEGVSVYADGDLADFPERSTPDWNRGKVLSVQGRLGEFQVQIQPHYDSDERPKKPFELSVGQVVLVSDHPPGLSSRTGIHYLLPGDDTEVAAEDIADLVGVFHKPEQVTYNPQTCAGGAADKQACGRCITFCPYDAIERDPANPLRMKVDQMSCEGCGACGAACPTSAMGFTDPAPKQIYQTLTKLLPDATPEVPPVIVFHCSQQGAEILAEAGEQGLVYDSFVMPVAVPCLRNVSEANILEAFRLGANGVALLGCEDCPNGERDLMMEKLTLSEQVLDAFGLGRDRLRLITGEASQASEAITALSTFTASIKPAPLPGGQRPPFDSNNREVLVQALEGLIAATGKEPGGIKVGPEQPFGYVDVKDEGCTLCRACTFVCPTHAFRFDMNEQVLAYKHISCIGCGLCVDACPEKVMTLQRELYLETEAMDYLDVVQDEMVACTKCEKPYINRKALESIEAKVFGMASLGEVFKGERNKLLRMCPDCRAVAAMMDVEKGWEV